MSSDSNRKEPSGRINPESAGCPPPDGAETPVHVDPPGSGTGGTTVPDCPASPGSSLPGVPALLVTNVCPIFEDGPVPVEEGGTGLAGASPLEGQLLIGDGTGAFALAFLTAGTNVTIDNGPGASVTINASGGSSYTDEEAQDAVGTILVDSDTIDLTYDDGVPSISGAVRTQMSVTSDASGVKLSGDEATPGTDQYYGTDGTGTKGYFDLPTGGGGAPTDAEYVVKSAHASLSAERVLSDSLPWPVDADVDITWDWTTSGEVRPFAQFRPIDGMGVIGLEQATGFAERPVLLPASTAGQVLRVKNDGFDDILGFGEIATAGIENDAVTYAKIQDISATSRILGRKTSGAGNTEECTLSEVLDFIGSAAQGDILYRGASAWARLAAGTAGQFLKTLGSSANPVWGDVAVHLAPGGRLSPATGDPVPSGGYASVGTIYYVPYVHDKIALYDGSSWGLYTFSELSLSLSISSGSNYDVFVYNNAGTITLELSAAWTNDTTRSTALTRQNGVLVKSGATTRRYVGTIRGSASNTTISTTSNRFIWNAYHRVLENLYCIDSTSNYNYTTNTWRQVNATASNKVEFIRGLDEDMMAADAAILVANPSTNYAATGVGVDSTSANSATIHLGGCIPSPATIAAGSYRGKPGLGYHYLAWLETAKTGGTTTWYPSNTISFDSHMSGMVAWGGF